VAPAEPLLRVDGLSASWADSEVVRSVSFAVAHSELLTLLGPNGSGKSTLLRAIAGFHPIDAGTVALAGRSLPGVPAHRRQIGILFQEPTLFPQRSVFENIAYGPMLAKRPRSEVDSEVESVARLLELEPLLDRPPDALSGGERQRVALARTLAARPRLVLLDEPFASVDPTIRASLHAQFRRALAERQTAAIHVTHDREEGLFLGDRVALLFAGRLRAIGPAASVFAGPPDAEVARFLGYNVVSNDGRLSAILPEELELGPVGDGLGPYSVVASGTTGRAFRAILERAGGERVEIRSAEPLPSTGAFSLRWRRSVPLDR
jgi:thiamine transport system ATP-binding protein